MPRLLLPHPSLPNPSWMSGCRYVGSREGGHYLYWQPGVKGDLGLLKSLSFQLHSKGQPP